MFSSFNANDLHKSSIFKLFIPPIVSLFIFCVTFSDNRKFTFLNLLLKVDKAPI